MVRKTHLSEFPLGEQPGDIYAITVQPAEFVTVRMEQWREYEEEAERLHIDLQVGPVSHGVPYEVFVSTRLANARRPRWGYPTAYDGPIGCKRPRWEHALRELLELDDPCFSLPCEQPE
jgi:hypothetical protein